MASHSVPERDWKTFRELREVALDRLCERALSEIDAVVRNSEKSNHERFRELYGLVRDRNHDVARAFDGPKRSSLLVQLSTIVSLGLLKSDELDRFTAETRDTIESLAKLR
jgi:hypothetical protein